MEDFESTLAELQSFIDGDVFTSLGGADLSQIPAPPGFIFIFIIRVLLISINNITVELKICKLDLFLSEVNIFQLEKHMNFFSSLRF